MSQGRWVIISRAMPTSNPLDILLAHDRWASLQILAACKPLTDDQLDRTFEIGPGTIRATITHMIAAMNAWSDTLAQKGHRERIDGNGVKYSVAELEKLLHAGADEFAGLVRAHPLDEVVTRERMGKVYQFTRGAILTHVATHGMHHRAQCLNMLRHLGVSPLPPSSVVEWARMVDDVQ